MQLFLYSLLINYELAVPAWRVILMPAHLTLDFAAAVLLAVAPLLFGCSHLGLNVWLPEVIVGVAVILLMLVLQTEPQEIHARRSNRVPPGA